SQNMGIDSFFLRHSVNKALAVYGVSADDVTNFILKSRIFQDSIQEIVHQCVNAYLDKDYMSEIQIQVLHAEAAIRTLVEFMGGATLRRNRQGGLQLRTFDDLLRDESVENCFGVDMSFYFRMLLTDQRGWNLRNDVCHGISPAGAFNYSTADRVMHVM